MTGFERLVVWGLPVGALALFYVAIARQHRAVKAVRTEYDQIVKGAVVATDLPPPQMAALASAAPSRDEADRAAILGLREEIDQLRERVAARERALHEYVAAQARARSTKPAIVEGSVPHTEWTRAGQTTPEAAVETTLWAASRGDLRVLEEVLTFDDDAKVAAGTLFNQLPIDVRNKFEGPAHLIALLTAADVPLKPANVGLREESPDRLWLFASFGGFDGPPHVVKLEVRADLESGEWRVVVPRSAIDAYAARLSGQRPSP